MSCIAGEEEPAELHRFDNAMKVTSSPPGSAHSLYLIVSDIEAAREELVARGVKVSEVFHPGTPGAHFQPEGASGRVGGPAPEKRVCSTKSVV